MAATSGPEELYRAPDPTGIFELVDLLGEGSYGSVYKGRHIRTGEIVAIKVIELVEEELTEIWGEINFLRMCKHANIVKYFGTYLRHDKLWLVMEICQGGSVMDLYKDLGRGLKEEQISYICEQSLRGLAYLHEKGIIHRDIKAGNILLTIDCEVKLADFGVSGLQTPTQRRRKTFIGTPYWMAPEVIACDKDEEASYDEKCDIWAMGITAIEMADTDPPLADLHPLRALFLIPANKPPTFAQPRKWSKQFRDFVKQCLVKDAAKRPSAAELLKHPFIKPKANSSRRAKNILQELVDRIASKIAQSENVEVVSSDLNLNEAEPEEEEREETPYEIPNQTIGGRRGIGARGTLTQNAPIGFLGYSADAPTGTLSKVPTATATLKGKAGAASAASAAADSSDRVDSEALGAWQNLMGRAGGPTYVVNDEEGEDDKNLFSNPLFATHNEDPILPHLKNIQMNHGDGSFIYVNPLSDLPDEDANDAEAETEGEGEGEAGAEDSNDDSLNEDVQYTKLAGSTKASPQASRVGTVRGKSTLRTSITADEVEELSEQPPTTLASAASTEQVLTMPASPITSRRPVEHGSPSSPSSPVTPRNHPKEDQGNTFSKRALAKLAGSLRGLPADLPPPPPETPEEASIETTKNLPFTGRATKKGTARLNAALAAMFKDDPTSPLPSSNVGTILPSVRPPIPTDLVGTNGNGDGSHLHVKALNLAKNFPFEIVCATTWGSRYLFGTPIGLFQLDKQGTLSRVIAGTRFTRMSVIEDYGVLLAICGRHQHIRMYNLQELYSKKQKRTGLLRREESFIKIKGTKHSSFYSVVRSKGTVFMVAAVRRNVVLFMWADYPFNKFMKIKDFYVPETVVRVHPVLTADGRLSQLIIQCLTRFLTINVDTSEPDQLSLPVTKKSPPLLLQAINAEETLIAFQRSGFILDTQTMQPKRTILNWRFTPLAIVPLRNELVLAFSAKMIDVFSKETGEIIQTIRHKESKKIRYLFTQNDDVLVAAKSLKANNSGDTSSVYIMRAVPLAPDTI